MVYTKKHTLSLSVDPFNTDFAKRWSWMALGRTLLNAAEQHAKARGFGMHDVNSENFTWVLSRLTIEMHDMPLVWDKVYVTTWIENIYRLFTNRNFSITGEDGRIYGYARSIWALIDYKTREPQNLESLYGDNFSVYLDPDSPCPIRPQSRIKPLDDDFHIKDIETEYTDIDQNGHVNSIKYIEHLMNLFPIENYEDGHNLNRVEIAYMAEGYLGDKLLLFKRESDRNTHEMEVKSKRNVLVDGESQTVNKCKDKTETLVRCRLFFQ